MKMLPKTLLGRTALLLGLLMLVSQIVWLACVAYFLIAPIRDAYAQQITAVILLAQETIEQRKASGNPEAAVFSYRPGPGFQIVSDSQPHPRLYASKRWVVPQISRILQQRFGPGVEIRHTGDRSVLWVAFPVKGERFWAVLPKGRPPLPVYMIISVTLGLAASIAAAYLIIYRLTQQLREVTAATRAVGRGEALPPLKETGAEEVLNLSKGFNQMAADLKKLDQDRRLMLAGISHDLKTPLTRLRLAVELAEARTEPELAAGMVHDIEDMDSILQQFLDYARDGTEEQPGLSDLNAIAADVADRYRILGATVALKVSGTVEFPFRKLAIYRVITNIVDNAVRYGRQGIEIETGIRGHHAILVVSDLGPGITSGIPGDFIKPFARENGSRTSLGTGLGLAIVDRVVRTHGGKLQVINREPHGLIVRIELPMADGPGAMDG